MAQPHIITPPRARGYSHAFSALIEQHRAALIIKRHRRCRFRACGTDARHAAGDKSAFRLTRRLMRVIRYFAFTGTQPRRVIFGDFAILRLSPSARFDGQLSASREAIALRYYTYA